MKKFKYILPLFQILFKTKNWIEVLSVYFFPREVILKLKSGEKFKINNIHNLISIKEIFLNLEYQIKNINPSTIIDIGANIGDSTVYFKNTYPKAKIYAFEPSNSIFSQLKFNISLNGNKNITLYKLGVGSKNGKVSFYDNRQSGLSSIYFNSKKIKKNIIQITTLKNIFKLNAISKCDLLKIDCEGAEYDIILNLDKKILDKVANMVIEFHEGLNRYDRDDLVNFLKKRNYKIKIRTHPIESNIGLIYARK